MPSASPPSAAATSSSHDPVRPTPSGGQARTTSGAESWRTELIEAGGAIDGAAVGEGAFGPGPAVWVGRREVAHFDADGALDVRLTRQVVRARRDELRVDPRVQLEPSTSDWISVLVRSPDDADRALQLVADAVDANLPSAPPGPPPTGTRARSPPPLPLTRAPGPRTRQRQMRGLCGVVPPGVHGSTRSQFCGRPREESDRRAPTRPVRRTATPAGLGAARSPDAPSRSPAPAGMPGR